VQPVAKLSAALARAADLLPAQGWNTRDGALAGYVTRFDVDDALAARYPVQTAGARRHRELWVPAEELDAFNRAITSRIEITNAFFGDGFHGVIPDEGPLAGRDATQQLCALAERIVTVHAAFSAHADVVEAHRFFWASRSFVSDGVDDAVRDGVLTAVAKLRSR
jgi:hypothetical protein